MKIGILGGGTMGEMIGRALLLKEVVRPEDLLIAEIDLARRHFLAENKLPVIGEPKDLVAFANVLVLCVKPQSARVVLAELCGKLPADVLVISIMAGIDIAYLRERLQHERVVRSMPNLPIRIGRGVTVWMAHESLPDLQKVVCRMIFQALGREVEVHDEDLLDAATAVTGTGPAYLFYIAENLHKAALSFGFEEQQALKLVCETFRGAMDLWASTGESPVELRRQVTSKGGTTHAAVTYFESRDIAGIFTDGVRRARDRAKELALLAKGEESD